MTQLITNDHQIDMVSDIVKMCDDLRLLIPAYVMMSNTEIMRIAMEEKLNDAVQKNEGVE